MFIEFELPNGAGVLATNYALNIIQKEFRAWAAQYGVKYKSKLHKYTWRVCFEQQKQYTFFQLSWHPNDSLALRYRLVER